ncbi:hypothetical protein HHI36_022743 [Cryptolaemus montrouzieri]|uniref:Uncharacterized protein n=1 Tax=Cryptolaemus montrouzieri TaxID=559131 RepID=A0ABD2N1H5_9CUCU
MAKKMDNSRYISNSNNKQRATWKLIETYTGNKPKNVSVLNKISTKDKTSEDILNELNAYFVSSGRCGHSNVDRVGVGCESPTSSSSSTGEHRSSRSLQHYNDS